MKKHKRDIQCKNFASKKKMQLSDFPNCAGTVESGSWCGTNDACCIFAIEYIERHGCNRAWKGR